MVGGTLEVTLVEARSLKKNMDFIVKMNPYVVIQYGNQKHTSTIAKGQGTKPVWNEKFRFDAEYPDGEDHKYMILFRVMATQKLMDRDIFVGESKYDVIASGTEKGKAELGVAKYRVVLQDKTYAGERQIIPEIVNSRAICL